KFPIFSLAFPRCSGTFFLLTHTRTCQVKNYFQRKIDSGNTEFEEIVRIAEEKKMRGEPTGPLPVPSVTQKRRYEATPSAVAPRPLAPHTDVDHADDGRKVKTTAPNAMSPPPASTVQIRSAAEAPSDRNMPRYPPLAQATGAPLATGTMLAEDPSRAIRPHGIPPPPRMSQGPRMGYFTEERRDVTGPATPSIAPSRPPQDVQPSPR
ncbi:MYB DNA-binding domain protein, partial [Rasamsonia emersonii CBS 393.64]